MLKLVVVGREELHEQEARLITRIHVEQAVVVEERFGVEAALPEVRRMVSAKVVVVVASRMVTEEGSVDPIKTMAVMLMDELVPVAVVGARMVAKVVSPVAAPAVAVKAAKEAMEFEEKVVVSV